MFPLKILTLNENIRFLFYFSINFLQIYICIANTTTACSNQFFLITTQQLKYDICSNIFPNRVRKRKETGTHSLCWFTTSMLSTYDTNINKMKNQTMYNICSFSNIWEFWLKIQLSLNVIIARNDSFIVDRRTVINNTCPGLVTDTGDRCLEGLMKASSRNLTGAVYGSSVVTLT